MLQYQRLIVLCIMTTTTKKARIENLFVANLDDDEQLKYDVVIYGATGFTGELTAEYLSKNS